MENLNISFINNEEDKFSAYQLWYKVYHDELNRNTIDLNHDKKIIYDSLEPNSKIISIKIQNELIGTFRLSSKRSLNNTYYSKILSEFSDDCYLGTKLIICKTYRGLGLSNLLFNMAMCYIRSKGGGKLVIDCNENRLSYFKHNGFKPCVNFETKSPVYGNIFLLEMEL